MWRLMTLLSSPAQNPKAGNLGPAKADGTWLTPYQPICPGIAELSQDGMARAASLLPDASPHALTLNIWCRRQESRSFPRAIFVAVAGIRETKSNRRRSRVSLNS